MYIYLFFITIIYLFFKKIFACVLLLARSSLLSASVFSSNLRTLSDLIESVVDLEAFVQMKILSDLREREREREIQGES